jgi:hypothetical protein
MPFSKEQPWIPLSFPVAVILGGGEANTLPTAKRAKSSPPARRTEWMPPHRSLMNARYFVRPMLFILSTVEETIKLC